MHIKLKLFGKVQLVCVLFLFICSVTGSAQQLKLHYKNVQLTAILEEITNQSGYRFVYSDALKIINEKKSFSIDANNQTLKEVLDKLFIGKGIVYTIEGKQIVLAPKSIVIKETEKAQPQRTVKVSGKVTDETGEPLPGVIVLNKKTEKFSASEPSGDYSIEAQEGNILSFASIGMANYEVVVGKGDILNITMTPNAISLSDVVVTGYQTISKERAAGSYAVVTTEKIEKKLQLNIMDRLEGMVVGMTMYKGVPVIRGTSTLYAEKAPLYVVDGVPFEGDIKTINPNDIANVSVLKDATASSIYGARSTNGVIVITTKTGSTGKLNINYNGTVSLTPLPNRDYANLMSSSQFIDYQMYMFDNGVKPTTKPAKGYSLNEVYGLLFNKRDGNISEEQFNSRINTLKGLDRYDQVKDEFLNALDVTHQHNLSFSGGSDFYKYSLSLNYEGTSPYEKGKYSDRLGFNVKNNFNLTKWLQVDFGIMGNETAYDYNDGVSGMSMLDKGEASYYMLREQNGSPVRWEQGKNMQEIERLRGIGLFDEAYYAVKESDKIRRSGKGQYINVNIGAKIKILESLNAEVRYQTERGWGYAKTYWTKDSWTVKNMVNDATQINRDGTFKHNIPLGGQVEEINDNNKSYTLRGQINYSKLFAEKHDVKILVGAERRKVMRDRNGHYRFGYDDYNLSFKNINEVELRAGIEGTEALDGYYQMYTSQPKYESIDDRYISFYGNASYVFNNRLGVNASIRMDQSNLFGTDPKYQYRPLWSVGANYSIFQEGKVKWLDRLSARATYGINGNVYKKSGPYIIAQVSRYPNWDTNEAWGEITSPPNSALRWEKTKTLNLGIDFSMFAHRLLGSVDFYNKKTTDLLGYRSADPTFGWDQLMMNYASMQNTGIEIVLESNNIVKKDFNWSTNVIFSYNKNKISDLENSETSAFSYIKGLQVREGKPLNSLYSVRYAGLDENGEPMAYKADGTTVKNTSKLTPEDLVYSGTYDPPYNAAMTNSFRYKGLELSFMFVYYGGHVMRDISAAYYPNANRPHESVLYNMDKIHSNFWRQSGDEKDLDKSPGYKIGAQPSLTYIWRAANKHIQKADYIKLRDISLAYSLPKALVAKARLSDVRFTFQAQNVWRWSANDNNLDPEVWTSKQTEYISRGTAIPPTFIFGLNLSF
ncbi:MAG: SusC/RagA family TonB-linked outer membrane protein [Bacteroidales bacterium]